MNVLSTLSAEAASGLMPRARPFFLTPVLNKHPDTVVVCGGDLNQLELKHLEA